MLGDGASEVKCTIMWGQLVWLCTFNRDEMDVFVVDNGRGHKAFVIGFVGWSVCSFTQFVCAASLYMCTGVISAASMFVVCKVA